MASPRSAARHALDGTVRIFLAESLLLPTALVTTAFVTRALGPAGFGLLSLATTLVTWLEWTTSSMLARATIKLVGDSDDWRRPGSAVVILGGATGLLAGVLLWACAGPIAAVVHTPELAPLLRVFAIDVPLFTLAQAHRNILMGLGEFRQRALVSAWRWIARMVLVIALVSLGLSITGAVLGSIGATLIELIVSRVYVHPPVAYPRDFPLRRLREYAVPLFLAAVATRLFDKVDLFMLTALGGTTVQAGEYGAAQSLAVGPALLSLALSMLLLATLTRLAREGDRAGANRLASNAMRAVLLLAPIAAIAAGRARGIVRLVFGAGYLGSAPLVALLGFAALALLMLSVTTAVITAAGRPNVVLALTAPLVPLAILGHVAMIPRYGPVGAASVTLGIGAVGAIASSIVAARLVRVHVPLGTMARCGVIAVAAFAAASAWRGEGVMLVVEIAVLSVGVAAGYAVLGELDADELALVRTIGGPRWMGRARDAA